MIGLIVRLLLCLGSWLYAVDVISVSPASITVAENGFFSGLRPDAFG